MGRHEGVRGPLGPQGVRGKPFRKSSALACVSRFAGYCILVLAVLFASLMIITTLASGADARMRTATTSRHCLQSETYRVLQDLEAFVGPVKLISTCRPGARIAGTRHMSHHSNGTAVDFWTPRKASAIRYLRSRRDVFVMTYRDMSHVHFNTGQIGARFGAWSGHRKRYAHRHKHNSKRRIAVAQ